MVVEARRGWLSETSCEPAVNACLIHHRPQRVLLLGLAESSSPHLLFLTRACWNIRHLLCVAGWPRFRTRVYTVEGKRVLYTRECKIEDWVLRFPTLLRCLCKDSGQVTVSGPAGQDSPAAYFQSHSVRSHDALHSRKKWLSAYNF